MCLQYKMGFGVLDSKVILFYIYFFHSCFFPSRSSLLSLCFLLIRFKSIFSFRYIYTKYSRNGRHSRSNINDLWNTFRPQVLVDESGSFHPDYLFATGRFAPLNRYYIDEVFFDNFLVIIYLLVVCQKKIIHSFWSTFVKDLKAKLFLQEQ